MPAQILKLELAAFLDASEAVQPTVTPHGTAGSTSYSYKLVAVNAAGKKTAAGTAGTTSTGNATLSGTNFNRVSWVEASGPTSTNVDHYEVYRTAGGATQGLIGTVLPGVELIDDTGLVGDASTPPAANNSGTGVATSTLHLDKKCLQVSANGGSFTGSVQVQGSVDGVEWENVGSAATAPGFSDVTRTYGLMRANVSALTAGSMPEVFVAGLGYGGG